MFGVISMVIDSWLFLGCIVFFFLLGWVGDIIDVNEDGSGYKFLIVMIEIVLGCVDICGFFQIGFFLLGIVLMFVVICIFFLVLVVFVGIGVVVIQVEDMFCVIVVECNMCGIQVY